MGIVSEIGKPDRLTARLAQCLRDLRHEAGWSLDELTDRCGVSRATLSRLEHAEVSPTAQALARIAAAYAIPASRLIRLAETEPPRVISRGDQAVRQDNRSGIEWRDVSSSGIGFSTGVAEGVLPQGCLHDLECAHGGREFHVVLMDGRLGVSVDGAEHELRKGDSLRFHCESSGQLRGIGKRSARFMLVNT